jgi:hypothetical protein
MSSPEIKNTSLYPKAKSGLYPPPSRPAQRGVGHRRNEGREAVDAEAATDERSYLRTVKACGPDVAVLASMHPGGNSLSGRYGGKRAVLRGDHVISRKAIAQGMSDVLRCPVCSCAHFLYTLRMRPRVQRASGIPCALCFSERATSYHANLGRNASRERRHTSSVVPAKAGTHTPQPVLLEKKDNDQRAN